MGGGMGWSGVWCGGLGKMQCGEIGGDGVGWDGVGWDWKVTGGLVELGVGWPKYYPVGFGVREVLWRGGGRTSCRGSSNRSGAVKLSRWDLRIGVCVLGRQGCVAWYIYGRLVWRGVRRWCGVG